MTPPERDGTISARRSPPLILTLDDPAATRAWVGGKGASLARLAAAGLPVPPGFHVTTVAYRRFVAHHALHDGILAAVAAASPDQPATLDAAAQQIGTLFATHAMPDDIAAAIRVAYVALGGDELPVAVRSSATAEDLPELSFAGQQDTFLNVHGDALVLDAVKRCWASLWTARAIGYRVRHGIAPTDVRLAVVVQELIPADASGILFTANPLTGARDQATINAVWGLGEAVVGGLVTPDTVVVEKASGAIADEQIAAKDVMTVRTPEGTREAPVPAGKRARAVLSRAQAAELAGLGTRIEALDGRPMDIEWAIHDGRIAILQARPITNLPPAPLPDVWEPPVPGSLWIRRQVVEQMPAPLSPLFEELYLGAGLERSLEAMQAAMGVPKGLYETLMDRPFYATVNGYAYMRGDLKLPAWQLPAVVAAMAVGVTKLLRNTGIAYWKDDGLPTYLATIDRWQGLDPVVASDEQLLEGVRELAWADARYWFACTLALGTAKVTDRLLAWFLSIAARGRGLTSGLFLRGFPSRTLEAQAVLQAIAARLRASEPLRALVAAIPAGHVLAALTARPDAREVLDALQRYLDRYGHQIYSLDFADPTQADDPLPVLISLKGMVLRPPRAVRAQLADLASAREALTTNTARSFGPLRGRLFRRFVRTAQRFAPYREEALFYLGAGWPVLRRLALELGRRLVAAGSLSQADDVFFLRSTELAEASMARASGDARPELVRLAHERRQLRAAQARLHPPAAVPPTRRFALGPIDLSGRESQRRNSPGGSTLTGFAVSPGRVTAPASVVVSPADFETMEPGSILICPMTTPAWTPLFAQARGLVTDIGGILAHGSIVAREYGIPAVMGTGIATQRIRSGQLVTVDGDAGTVTLAEEQPRVRG